jgi:anthranilate synthase/aminodeoxychorismate synthase-like glutamine amidotransferase
VRVLVIDNYDSFTFNLVQALRELGADVVVRRNDEVDAAGAVALEPTHVVVSPGPGRPREAGCSIGAIRAFAGRRPVLGVCLGHQAMAEAFGGEVSRARRLMHGKASRIRHDGRGLFEGLPAEVEVGRYHSLAVAESAVPRGFEVSARAEDGEVMGMRHAGLGLEGVQFHPESVMTPLGPRMLGLFLRMRVAGTGRRAADAAIDPACDGGVC